MQKMANGIMDFGNMDTIKINVNNMYNTKQREVSENVECNGNIFFTIYRQYGHELDSKFDSIFLLVLLVLFL